MSSIKRSRFSIVTPSYNQGSFIAEALESVKNQNHPDVQHIVVDGGSTDCTIEVLKDYASRPGWEHLTWISEPDDGQADAINKGFRVATGDIFAYLCADDLYSPGAFAKTELFFTEHPDVDVIYGACSFINDEGRLFRVKNAVPFDRSKLLKQNLIWQPAAFFRSRVWRLVGEFNLDLDYAIDYEYWLRASKICRIEPVDENLAFYRFQAESKSVSRNRQLLREAYDVSRRFGGGGLLSWYLHNFYWPNTSRAKRWLFERFSF